MKSTFATESLQNHRVHSCYGKKIYFKNSFTYQKPGFIKDDKLILYPQQQWPVVPIQDDGTPLIDEVTDEQVLLAEAIAWYQSASIAFARGDMKYTK